MHIGTDLSRQLLATTVNIYQFLIATDETMVRMPIAQPVTSTVLTIDELSSYLKIPKPTLYKLAQEGRMPGQKVGRHWRFHKEAIDRWLIEGSTNIQAREREHG